MLSKAMRKKSFTVSLILSFLVLLAYILLQFPGTFDRITMSEIKLLGSKKYIQTSPKTGTKPLALMRGLIKYASEKKWRMWLLFLK